MLDLLCAQMVGISTMIPAQTIIGKQNFRLAVAGGDAGGGDGVLPAQSFGDFAVEREQLFEQVFLGAETVGGEDGGVERGVGVAQRVPAGQVEAAVEEIGRAHV